MEASDQAMPEQLPEGFVKGVDEVVPLDDM